MERRLKILYVSPDAVIQCFTGPKHEYCNKIKFHGIPEDCKVKTVSYCPMRQAWMYLLEHPSFDIVSEHHTPPEVIATYETVKVQGYRCFPDVPIMPDPPVKTVSLIKDENSKVMSHIAELFTPIQWYNSETEQMKRYGIKGWTVDNVAIWEEGRGPQDGTIVVRGKAPELNGKFFTFPEATCSFRLNDCISSRFIK